MEIRLENLSYVYKSFRRHKTAIDNANAVIKPGLYVLLGENGAGKTTLMQIIAGLRYPTSGKCYINEAQTKLRLPSILSHTSFLGSEAIFPGATINEMVKIHSPFYPRFDMEMLNRNLRDFNLSGDEKLKHLSFGNRHKAMVAYNLALRTEIALYDEPATGLDIESKETLRKLVAADTDETQTVIISTHNIDDLRTLYDGVIILSDGKLLLCDSTEHIASRLLFKRVREIPEHALYSEPYGGEFHVITPNEGDEETNVDYRMLYLALRSKNQSQILKQLNNGSKQ